uniref:Uncharacterized protein n=1 Tax=Aegilops tauschii subsp. strangulata TaxID=200361 RepID=A0A452XFG3_AEGTS
GGARAAHRAARDRRPATGRTAFHPGGDLAEPLPRELPVRLPHQPAATAAPPSPCRCGHQARSHRYPATSVAHTGRFGDALSSICESHTHDMIGCVLCRKRADLLAAKQEAMEAAGVSLVLIGPGTVEQAKAFSDQTKFKGEVYADPDYSSYKALEFANGLFSTFTPSAGLKIIQLYREGYRQDWELSFEKNTRTKGGWYQGGLLVAGPGIDNISYIHKDKEAGDDPEMEDV